MNTRKEEIIEKALTLVKSHFEQINLGNFEAIKEQLFWPKEMAENPINVYFDTMSQMKPFHILSITVSRFEDIRRKRHGDVATIWINIETFCAQGKRKAEIIVWWFPDTNEYRISSRPSEWVISKLQENKISSTKENLK